MNEDGEEIIAELNKLRKEMDELQELMEFNTEVLNRIGRHLRTMDVPIAAENDIRPMAMLIWSMERANGSADAQGEA